MAGVMLLWIIPKIQHQTAWFRFLHIGFMVVGLSSLVSINTYGANTHNRYDAVIFELGIPALLMLWQWTLARKVGKEVTV
ncbi:MAG: hypothetical protein ACI9JM_001961 [Halioglobus sp.]|jgi:hypothetical protein